MDRERDLRRKLQRGRLVEGGRIRFGAAREAVTDFGAEPVVTYLVETLAERSGPVADAHRDVARLIGRIGEFEPDVRRMFNVYRRADRHSATRVLVAWMLSRQGMAWLSARLGSYLGNPDSAVRSDAEELRSEAERWAGSDVSPAFQETGRAFPELEFPEREEVRTYREPAALPSTGEEEVLYDRAPAPQRRAVSRGVFSRLRRRWARPAGEARPIPRKFGGRGAGAPEGGSGWESEEEGGAVGAEPPEEAPGDRAIAAEPPEEAPGDRAVAAEPPAPPGPPEPSAPPPDEGPRWLLSQVLDRSGPEPKELTKAFRANAPHDVVVLVASRREGFRPPEGATPADSVDAKLADTGAHELTVIFMVAGEVHPGTIVLPPTGPSNTVNFGFTAPPAGQRVDATITILYQNRVLQTANLSGLALDDPSAVPPESEMTYRLAVIKPGTTDLGDQQPFDAAVVTGPTEEAPVVVGVHSSGLVPFDSDRLPGVVNEIRNILDGFTEGDETFKGGLEGPGAAGLLRALAFQGCDLYKAVGEKLEQALAGAELSRIQVVLSEASDFIPVEFIYDFPAPTLDAGVCPNWKVALQEGRCDPANHPAGPLPGEVTVVCPLGFWTLKKVIERQVIDADDEASLVGKDFGIRAEPTADRPHLDGLKGALVAWSDLVAQEGRDQLVEALKEATADHSLAVHTWQDWVAAIPDRRPTLLVLLSHTVREQNAFALEIGPPEHGSRRVGSQFVSQFIKVRAEDAPVVLLLGCDTAVARMELQTFVGRFRDLGAALVVGTVSPVLADRAASVAAAVVRELRAATDRAAAGVDGTFGEAMLGVRRNLLATGELTALAITAFGDADWRVGTGPGG